MVWLFCMNSGSRNGDEAGWLGKYHQPFFARTGSDDARLVAMDIGTAGGYSGWLDCSIRLSRLCDCAASSYE